jgi:hypothetical protein
MRFRDDERGAAVQIGAVLLLGFLVASLSLYQATVVPQQNEAVEFEHNQRVQSDLQGVRNAVLGTAATGTSTPTSVELGTRYASRTLFVNPPPASGRLATSDLGNITVHIASADDLATDGADYPETADFWNGTNRTYRTAALSYQPDYARYQNAPTTVYENGVLYNRLDGGSLTLTGQPVVSGKRISLVALSGSLSRSGTRSLSVNPRAVSVSTRTVSVSNTTNNVSVVLPTELDADTWRDLLAETGEFDPAADESDGSYVYRVEDRPEGVELYFERNATYQLKLAKVGVGSAVGDTDPAYVTSAEDPTAAPFTNRTYPFEVEVRDKYNNPVPTVVRASAARGDVPPGAVVAPGRFRYRYEAPASAGPDWVNVSYGDQSSAPFDVDATTFDGSKAANVQYEVGVQAMGGGGGGSGNNDGPDDLPPNPSGDRYVAYDDADGDGAYDSGETTYTASDLNGFSDSSANLVVGENVNSNGKITISSADSFEVERNVRVESKNEFKVGNGVGAVHIDGTVESQNNKVTLSPSGDLTVEDGTVRAKNEIKMEPTGGDISITQSTVDTANGKITIKRDGGRIDLTGSDLLSKNEILVEASSDLVANDAQLDSANSKVTTESENGNIELRRATVRAKNERTATVNSASQTVYVDSMKILDRNGNPADLNVDPDPAASGTPDTGTVN